MRGMHASSALGLESVVVDRSAMDLTDKAVSGILLQYPDTRGNVYDLDQITDAAHKNGVSALAAS